jgi:hypothetical protein
MELSDRKARHTYAHEREVRFIIMNVTAKFDAHRKTFNGKNYIEVPLPLKSPGSIMLILVGAHTAPGAENMVSDFLRGRDRRPAGRCRDRRDHAEQQP